MSFSTILGRSVSAGELGWAIKASRGQHFREGYVSVRLHRRRGFRALFGPLVALLTALTLGAWPVSAQCVEDEPDPTVLVCEGEVEEDVDATGYRRVIVADDAYIDGRIHSLKDAELYVDSLGRVSFEGSEATIQGSGAMKVDIRGMLYNWGGGPVIAVSGGHFAVTNWSGYISANAKTPQSSRSPARTAPCPTSTRSCFRTP